MRLWIAIGLAMMSGCPRSGPAPAGQKVDLATSSSEFSLHELTITELQRRMTAGELTSRVIVEQYLTRIGALDKQGPALHAVIEINPDALAIADQLDAERDAGRVRGPLHGIPVLLKDNIATADAMETSAGSLTLIGARPRADSAVAQRLREAGAVLLGKANLSEWANFRSSKSSSGWSARGGQTRNPYVLDRSPCGSSAGSAVAVSANLCAVAIGTETDGSIVCPSSANGIVGIKPTVGLVSAAGIIPISRSQDTAGPMARTVADAAIVLSVLSGRPEYLAALDPGALAGARIGVWRAKLGHHPEVDRVMDAAIAAIRTAGATVIDVDFSGGKQLDDAEIEVLLFEFKAGLTEYLGQLDGDGPKNLAEVIALNERYATDELAHFGQDLFVLAESRGGLDDPAYLEAKATARRLAGTEGIDAIATQHRLDAIIAPTGSPAWPIDLINGDHFTMGSSTPAAVAGYPNITVPAGFVSELPVGISFFARADTEARLISIAYSFEQITKARRAPKMIPTLTTSTSPQ